MLNETMEADREYRKSLNEEYEKGYAKGKADAEPRTGKWEPQSGGGYCCSVCGRYAMDKADGRIVMISVKSKFCPNCGAKMEVTE